MKDKLCKCTWNDDGVADGMWDGSEKGKCLCCKGKIKDNETQD